MVKERHILIKKVNASLKRELGHHDNKKKNQKEMRNILKLNSDKVEWIRCKNKAKQKVRK